MSSSLLVPEEQVLSTLRADGSRRWLKPHLSKGPYWRARQAVAYLLIVVFVAISHIQIGGKPAILLDIMAREFTFFGFTFLPTDTLLLALFLLATFLSIFLLTAIFGRLWCGWACPQTVYMEYVFRPIERFFEGTIGHGGQPRRPVAGWRRVARFLVYLLVSMGLAHTFLAYFVGVDKLSQWVRLSPLEHPVPFLVMGITTGLMLFDFGFFREQLCLIACPYWRFQSVLLDRQSLIVTYDKTRGEPRGKVSKANRSNGTPVGDCVDCSACVRVCPTGIDIRDGLQMECINCTQCIDACDVIMERLNRPKGLIRYSCQATTEGHKKVRLRPRLVVYGVALLVVIGGFVATLASKQAFDVTLLRSLGNPYITAADGQIQNSLRLKLVSRTDEQQDFQIRIAEPDDIALDLDVQNVTLGGGQTWTQPVLVTVPPEAFTAGKLQIRLAIESSTGKSRVVSCQLLGPYNPTR